MNSQALNLIIGALAAFFASAGAAWFVRRKTRAETSHLDADSADVLSQAAARLIPLYDSWVKEMEKRLTRAQETAELAISSEKECKSRINDMQEQNNNLQMQIDDLRRQLNAVEDVL